MRADRAVVQSCADPGIACGAGAEVVFLVIGLRQSVALLHQLLIRRSQACCRVTVPLCPPLFHLTDRLAIANAVASMSLAAHYRAVFVVGGLCPPQVAVEDHVSVDATAVVVVCLLIVVSLGLHLASLSQG